MMKKTWKSAWLLCLVLLITIGSCKDEDLSLTEPAAASGDGVGRLKANPFSFESMSQALDEIKAESPNSVANTRNYQLGGPTSYYVRFTPQTEEQYDILESEFGIEIFTYPLDADFLNESYVEPPLPSLEASHYYTTVGIDYSFSNGVPYEILYSAYLPLEDEALIDQFMQERVGNNPNDGGLVDDDYPCDLLSFASELENTSLANNGYGELIDGYSCSGNTGTGTGSGSGDSGGTNTYPADRFGRITASDEVTDGIPVPVQGVKVVTTRFLSTKTSYTDANGYYEKHSSHRGKRTRYTIKFERDDFLIRQRNWKMAKVKGGRQTAPWSHHMSLDTEENYWASIFRAAHHYYHLDILGLRRPPRNSFFKRQLKIKAYYEDDQSTHVNVRFLLGIGSDIKIKRAGREVRNVYANVIHEIAHASHWSMDKSNYRNMNDCSDTGGLYCSGDQEVVETWARGVEWALTNMVYAGDDAWVPFYNRPRYTGLVQDLVDGVGQTSNNRIFGQTAASLPLTYQDNVSGYTLRQVEDALIGQRTWEGWRDNIISLYFNSTESHVPEAFTFWSTIN